MTIIKRLFYRKAPPLAKTPPAPVPAVPHSPLTLVKIHNREYVHGFFKDAPTASLELAHKVIGAILKARMEH